MVIARPDSLEENGRRSGGICVTFTSNRIRQYAIHRTGQPVTPYVSSDLIWEVENST